MLLSLGLLLIAMLSIQFGATQAKQLFDVLSPAVITMIRTGIACFLLLSWFRPWKTPLTRNGLLRVATYGIVLGLMNLTFYFSLKRIPLGIAVALEFVGPLGVALMGSRKALDWLWTLLAAVGIYLLVPWGGVSSDLDPLGVGLALLAGFCWGLYIIFGKRIGDKATTGQAASYGMGFAALSVLPFGLAEFDYPSMTPRLWMLGVMVAILSSAIPYSLEMIVMRRMDSKTFGTLMSIEPALAALMGLFVLHEKLNPVQILAMSAIVIACLGSTRGRPVPE